MADPRSFPSAEAGARLSDGELDQQMKDHGWLAVASGICLILTGPTTPSFVLFTYVPGWPAFWGTLLAGLGVALLVCRGRNMSLELGQGALWALMVGHAIAGAVLVATWAIWRFGTHEGSEPLLVMGVGLLWLALRCGRILAANHVRKDNDIGPTCTR